MLKRIRIREEYCMGCRVCEVYCVTQHSPSGDIIKTYKGKEDRPLSGLYFEDRGSVSFALQCRHCEDAPCLQACLTGALYRDDDTGRILHKQDKCVGCWMCIMSCPLGVIKPDFANRRIASKCDLCLERGYPVCVEHCPNEAIVVVDENEAIIRRE